MQGNLLCAEKVVSWSKGLGNSEGVFATVGVEGLVSPCLRRWVVSFLANFEPRAGSVRGSGIGDLAHVNDNWAVMIASNGLFGATSAVVSMHLYGNSLTGCR